MTEDKLVEIVRSGDRDGYFNIVEKYNKLLWVIVGGVIGVVGTAEDIEECVSDVYISLWRNPKAFDPHKGSLKTFLSAIAKRKALDRYRQLVRKQTSELDEMLMSQDDDLIEYVTKRDLQKVLYDAVESLKEPDKEILIRRYFFDEKPSDIAIKLSLQVKEIKNRLYQSKLKLMKLLKSEEVKDFEK